MQIVPLPSIACAPGALTFVPTATMAPPRTCTSPLVRSPILSSIDNTCAPRTTNSPRAGSTAGAGVCARAPAGKMLAAVSAVVAVKIVRRSIALLDMKFPRGRFGGGKLAPTELERQFVGFAHAAAHACKRVGRFKRHSGRAAACAPE